MFATMKMTIPLIGAVVPFLSPALASADPLPPAPCSVWHFDGSTEIEQSNGWSTRFDARGTDVHGPAHSSNAGNPDDDIPDGTIQGRVEGGQVYLKVRWDSGVVGVYDGTVFPDGIARGDTYDATNPASRAKWRTVEPLACPVIYVPPHS